MFTVSRYNCLGPRALQIRPFTWYLIFKKRCYIFNGVYIYIYISNECDGTYRRMCYVCLYFSVRVTSQDLKVFSFRWNSRWAYLPSSGDVWRRIPSFVWWCLANLAVYAWVRSSGNSCHWISAILRQWFILDRKCFIFFIGICLSFLHRFNFHFFIHRCISLNILIYINYKIYIFNLITLFISINLFLNFHNFFLS